uniref:Ion_trans domain-containing protein n=1 Tax=Brugia timori TaxID=42155 RepID=A0A0R3QX91_9BILA
LPRRGKRRLCSDGERNDVKSTKLIKSSESDGVFSAKKKRKSVTVMPRGVFIGKIDVLALHMENGVENEEQLVKSVISYLISHQYRRSETAQTNMQICLEHVLLDGLSVAETLKIHDGPNEGILEIYHKRCRDAFTALTVDFPTFSVALNLLNGREFNFFLFLHDLNRIAMPHHLNLGNKDEKNRSRKKPSRISSVKMEKSVVAGDVTNIDTLKFDTVEKLLISIPEKAKTLLHNYIMKLLDINFPLEKRLIGGLLQMIAKKMALKYVLGDKLLEDCVTYFHEKHNNFLFCFLLCIMQSICSIYTEFYRLSDYGALKKLKFQTCNTFRYINHFKMNSKATSGNFTKSFSYEAKDSGSTARQSSEELSPIPDSTEVDQPSGSIPEQMEFLVGEDTEQLSDVTDPDIYSTRSSAAKSRDGSSSRFFIWFRRVYPLMRNKKVRYLTIINTILLLINFVMLLFMLALLLNQIILAFRISSIMYDQPSPCIFTYEPWSTCSASCWDGSSNYPQMQRYVNKNSIVQARGGEKPDCPDDLHSRVDVAPCNTFSSPSHTGATGSDQPAESLPKAKIDSPTEEELPQNEKSPIPSTTDVEQLSEQAPGMFKVSAGEATEEVCENFIKSRIQRRIITFRRSQ